jgi:hypothetical protein
MFFCSYTYGKMSFYNDSVGQKLFTSKYDPCTPDVPHSEDQPDVKTGYIYFSLRINNESRPDSGMADYAVIFTRPQKEAAYST